MSEFTFRRAELRDLDAIYTLSNERFVRNNSIHPEDIIYSDHAKWFHNILSNENVAFLVVEIDNSFAGQVKFVLDRDQAIISLSLINSQRGQGLGSNIIEEAVKYLVDNKKGIEKIIAYVKSENIASVKSFEKAGFSYTRCETVMSTLLNRYEKLIPGRKL